MHQAADGLIARLRLPGGRLTPAQARVIAEFAAPGDSLELTSRGNLQLRGLGESAAAAAVGALASAGLTPSPAHDRARTIVASPLLGRYPGPPDTATSNPTDTAISDRRDTTPSDQVQAPPPGRDARDGITDRFITELDDAIRSLEETTCVSGRVLTVVDDGTGHALASAADVLAQWDPSAAAVRLVLGGREAGIAFLADAPRQAAVLLGQLGRACTEANVWRARELPETTLVALAQAAGGSGHPADSVIAEAELPIGAVEQADGRGAVRAIAPLGRLTGAQLTAAANLAARAGTDLRIDDRRGLTLVDLPPASLASTTARLDPRSIAAALAAPGLITVASDPGVGLTACAGAACTRTSVDVRAAAQLRLIERRAGEGLEHLVGCTRRCGAPRTGITVIAEPTDSPAELAARAVLALADTPSSAEAGPTNASHRSPTGPEAAR